MRNPRRGPLAKIVVPILLLPNLAAIAAIVALLTSTPTTAHVTDCHHSYRSTTCYGTWPGGEGQIGGADYGDIGQDIPINVALPPIGAYTGASGLLVWLAVPGFLDVVTVLGVVVWFRTRRRLTGPAAAVARRRGRVLTLRVSGDRVTHPGGAAYLVPGSGPGRYVTSGGTPVLGIDRTDAGYGEPRSVVHGPDDAPLGELLRTHPGIGWLEFCAVRDGQLVLKATARASSQLPLTGPDGAVLGELGIQDPDVVLVNLDVPLAEPANTLLLALALDIVRLASTRPHRGGAAQYG